MQEISIPVLEIDETVSALLQVPAGAEWVYVFGHGAGAGMRHSGMQAIADSLARVGIGTLRYNFPYMEKLSRGDKLTGQRFHKPPLLATVRAVVKVAKSSGLRIAAGGKSMGGRMTSLALAESALPGVEKLVFYGFPLHPSGKPSTDRAEHLAGVSLPMLFLQGTKDTLATPELIHDVVASLGERATLYEISGADHSFHISKARDAAVIEELAGKVAEWLG